MTQLSHVGRMAPPKLLLTIDEAAVSLGVGKTLLSELLARKEIASIKMGRRRLIPLGALEAYVALRLSAT